MGEGLNQLESCYLQTISYVKSSVERHGHTRLSKTQKMFGLLCSVLKVISYRLNVFSAY